MNRPTTLACLVTFALLSTAALGVEKKTWIVEAAPLRGVMGHPAVRAELAPRSAFSGAIAYEASQTASQRDDFKDTRWSATIEGFWYPWSLKESGLFVGSGISWGEATIGRQGRDAVSAWARNAPGGDQDLWVNHDTYLSFGQSVGYRVVAEHMVTASLRVVRDEMIQQRSRAERDDVSSNRANLKSQGREPVTMRMMLYAGLLIN